MMGEIRPILFEVLEPRILLSADGLLNIAVPVQDQDTLPDGMQQLFQYAELLQTQEQIEEQVTSDTSNNDNCRPILTLFVDDDNTNDESSDADVSFDNIGPAQNGEIALLSNDFDGDIESKVGTTEDGSTPTYVNDGEISVEETLSIEIRGPPASETVNSEMTTSSSINNEESEAVHTILDEHAAESQPDGTVNLPGLVLVDPDLTNLEGQIVYVDFDGEEDVIYDGPVTVGPFDVPAFEVSAERAGQEGAIIHHVLDELNELFAGLGVVFTTEIPDPTQPYSTVYVGGDDSAFSEYGSFLGLAEQVDMGNHDRSDDALVFPESISLGEGEAKSYSVRIAEVIAHETAHLVGYAHDSDNTSNGVLFLVAEEYLHLPEEADISGSGPDVQTGLIGYWDFNEGSGNVVHDCSGNRNDGIVMDATWTDGKYGTGLYFDGVDDLVEVPDDPTFHFTDEMTMAAWVRSASLLSAGNIINKTYSPDCFLLFYDSSGFTFRVVFSGGDWGRPESVNAPANIDNWTHVAAFSALSRILGCLVMSIRAWTALQGHLSERAFLCTSGPERQGWQEKARTIQWTMKKLVPEAVILRQSPQPLIPSTKPGLR